MLVIPTRNGPGLKTDVTSLSRARLSYRVINSVAGDVLFVFAQLPPLYTQTTHAASWIETALHHYKVNTANLESRPNIT